MSRDDIISTPTLQAPNANQIFARVNVPSETPDTTWGLSHITSLCNSGNISGQSNSTRKLWSLENITTSPLLQCFYALHNGETAFSLWHFLPFYISLLSLSSAIIPQHTVFLMSSWLPRVWLALDHTVQGIKQHWWTPQGKNSTSATSQELL